MSTKLVMVWTVTATLITACAGNIAFLATSTPTPTRTPLPTSTALPTHTPTLTPTPTSTPAPTRIPILGIDIPVELGSVTMLFTKAWITDDYYNKGIYDREFKSYRPAGQTLLVTEGKYTGGMNSVFGKDVLHLMVDGYPFYLEGWGEPHNHHLIVNWSGSSKDLFSLVVIIDKGDQGPFILHDKVHGWVVDLTPIMTAATPTPTITPSATRTPLPTGTP